MNKGQIIKALSGFYYVHSDNKEYACKGRGLFRKQKVNPLVGDFVLFDITENGEGYIKEILPRKNSFIRPPVANITQAILVCSATAPKLSLLLLDRFIALMESKQIKPIIVITKIDLCTEDELKLAKDAKKLYEMLGYQVFLVHLRSILEFKELKLLFEGETSVVTGQTGVGKSTLLNSISPSLNLETKEVSQSLGRGKHTTRHVEMHLINNGLVADTPGFSQLQLDHIELAELTDYFIEMKALKTACKFRGCLHQNEPKCAVKEALKTNEIKRSRYENYLNLLEEIQNRKPRY